MLSILRTRVVALPGLSSATRFVPAISTYSRALSSTSSSAFANSYISRQYGEDRRGGFNDRYESSPRQSFRNTFRSPKNPPSPTLWVGNLPFNATPAQVEELFTEFGTVLSVRLGMSPTGESKGFAHVDFSDVAAAESIMQANSESQFFLDGRSLNLDYAGPPSSRPSFPPSNTLHFSNFSGDEPALHAALEQFAPVIKSIRLMRNPQTRESSRFGFIECATQEDATSLIEAFNKKEILQGEPLGLSYARGRRAFDSPPRHVDQGGDGYGFGAGRRPGGFNNRSQDGNGEKQGFNASGEEHLY